MVESPLKTSTQQTPPDSATPEAMREELLALQKRRERRVVADGKREWTPFILAGITSGIVGYGVYLQEKYHKLVDLARQLRHAENDIDRHRLAELKELPEIRGVYEQLAQKSAEIQKLAGGKAIPTDETFLGLSKHFSTIEQISVDERLKAVYKANNEQMSRRPFRNVVDEKVVDELHNNNILSLRWKNLSKETRTNVLIYSLMAATAIGAVVYAVTKWLTSETRGQRKERAKDENMAEEARAQGYAELVPSHYAADIGNFRQRLMDSRKAAAASIERVL